MRLIWRMTGGVAAGPPVMLSAKSSGSPSGKGFAGQLQTSADAAREAALSASARDRNWSRDVLISGILRWLTEPSRTRNRYGYKLFQLLVLKVNLRAAFFRG